MISTVQIKELLIQTFELDMHVQDISDDMAIIGDGLELDSVDMLEIVTQLEKQFKIKIKGEAIKKEYFSSVQALTDFVNQLLQLKEEVMAVASL